VSQPTTTTATASGQDPLGGQVHDVDTATVAVVSARITLYIQPSESAVEPGQSVAYTYYLTNTGDVALTSVQVVDDNGTPGDEGDDVTVCSGITLQAAQSTDCSRDVVVQETTTSIGTASGLGPLGEAVVGQHSATVQVLRWVYRPIVTSR
jgi:hypothetical protein